MHAGCWPGSSPNFPSFRPTSPLFASVSENSSLVPLELSYLCVSWLHPDQSMKAKRGSSILEWVAGSAGFSIKTVFRPGPTSALFGFSQSLTAESEP